MQPLKLGVLGASNHFFRRCFKPLQQSDKLEVYAIASRNKEKIKNVSEEWGIPVYYNSYDKLLADKNVDAVYIPLPNHMHGEWIKKCADAGKHIICEKPLTLNAEEAVEVTEYVKQKNVKLMEAFMYKFHPKWIGTKDIIKTGEIGKVTSIHTIFTYKNIDPNNIRNIKDYGGGALMDIGCYAISTARFILDEEPKKVMALAEFDKDFGTDILTSGILSFSNSRCLFTVSTQSFSQQEVNIYGTDGTITITIPFNDIPSEKGKIILETSKGKKFIEFEPVDQYGLEFDAFVDSVKNNKEVPISLEESINNMKVIDAVRKSYETGEWIEV